MCGIVGICRLEYERDVEVDTLLRMMQLTRYRGPDEAGIYIDDSVGLGHNRLSIIDLDSGCQPIHNEDQTLWVVYNGEVFNYIELREELRQKGHDFYTTSDTEVVLHLYEQEGPQSLERLNGQFALAIWDSQRRELFLARDRVGIRPLHYTVHNGTLLFGSEAKSLFSVPGVSREIDPRSLNQIFTLWTVLPGRTAFRDIDELPPGHYMTVSRGSVRIARYWDMPIYDRSEQFRESAQVLAEQVRDLLEDAVRVRLRADVPVGCYLSGGLDSSGIAAIIARRFNANVSTFGIRFEDGDFDEGQHQQAMASCLGTCHHEVAATSDQIGSLFAEMLWHSEKPLLRTAPVPLLMLSKAVREDGLKVVLTGEGADEVFGGYNIFKEAKVRAFWARQPESAMRASLLSQLYGYVFRDQRGRRFLNGFFAGGLGLREDPLYSHMVRWQNTSRIKTFFARELSEATVADDVYEEIRMSLPDRYRELDVIGKAQYLETMLFLSQYLLSSQGDRVAMANSVEIRLPFLDFRVIDFMARVPSKWKILGLTEKYILRKCLADLLPGDIVRRQKQPYRAPIACSLLNAVSREFAMAMLSPAAVKSAGLFDLQKVERLVGKMERLHRPSEVDSMALAGVLSSQIIHQQFVQEYPRSSGEDIRPQQVIDRRTDRERQRASSVAGRSQRPVYQSSKA